MNATRIDRVLWRAITIGATLVAVGWIVDFRSSSDPHFWDSLGFAVIAIATASLLFRNRRSFPGIYSRALTAARAGRKGDRWWILSIAVGAVLVGVGWAVDFYSSSDPHFWDSLGFAIMAFATCMLLVGKRKSVAIQSS